MNASDFLESLKPKPYLEFKEYNFTQRFSSMEKIAGVVCPGFELTEHNRNLYENGVRYMAGDPESKFPLNKGLLLFGPPGTGKSLFFKIMNLLNSGTKGQNGFTTIAINQMIDGIAKNGLNYFSQAGITFPNHVYGFDSSKKHLFLDDLCLSSDSVNYFGNTIDLVFNFIQRRYIAYTDNSILTHITTNLKPNLFKEHYGEAVFSRMNQMFHPLPLMGKDFRK